MRKLLPALFGLLATVVMASHASAQMVNAQSGTTYTIANTDCDPQGRKLLTFNNAASVAVTLPQAGLNGLFLGGCVINVQNLGLGSVTITPTTSTISGQTSIVLGTTGSAAIYNSSSPSATGNYFASLGGTGLGGSNDLPLNLLDNGEMQVQQRGTGTRTCAQNAGLTSAAYVADRWGCSANVASGAAQAASLTTGLPVGFNGAMKIWRNSAALTQPVCAVQEITSGRTLSAAGGMVSLSFQAQALAGLAADNGNVINAYIIYGTGADQGLGTMTASPAITPAWTGINATLTQAFTLSTSWARYSMSANLPGTATEAGVMLCFTPTATGAGSTDGFAFSGAQFEANPVPSGFEFRSYASELLEAQSYYWQVADPAATVEIPSSCFVTAANTTVKCGVWMPVTMRVAPTTAVGTSTSFGIIVTAGTAGTCTTLAATASSNTLNSIGVTCTTGGTIALGSATPLIGAATGGILSASADF